MTRNNGISIRAPLARPPEPILALLAARKRSFEAPLHLKIRQNCYTIGELSYDDWRGVYIELSLEPPSFSIFFYYYSNYLHSHPPPSVLTLALIPCPEPPRRPQPVSIIMPPRKKAKTTKAKNEQTPATTEAGSSKANKSRSGGVARRDRNLRGKRGGLESMPNLPLDVLIEVRSITCLTCDVNLAACLHMTDFTCRYSASSTHAIF